MPSGYRHLTRHDRCQIQARGKRSFAAGHRGGDRPLAVHREPRDFPQLRAARLPPRPGRPPADDAGALEGGEGVSRPPVEPVADPEPAGRRGACESERDVDIPAHMGGPAAGGDLFLCLRHRGRRRNRRGRNGAGRGVIPGRVDISERPAIVEGKVRVGDWEVDTIVGACHSGAIV